MNLLNGISSGVFVMTALMVLSILFLLSMFARLYRKAGPHEALVVYGFRGTRVVKGHGTVIFPMIESCRARKSRARLAIRELAEGRGAMARRDLRLPGQDRSRFRRRISVAARS